MIKATVNARNWGPEFAKEINLQVKVALEQASELGAQVASRAVTRRRTGDMADIEAVPVRGIGEGWSGGFKSKAWYSHFQSRGTKRGITALGHEEAGLAAAKKDLIARIDRMT